jgi:uncharacterized protein YktA (UPF0223 family)
MIYYEKILKRNKMIDKIKNLFKKKNKVKGSKREKQLLREWEKGIFLRLDEDIDNKENIIKLKSQL